MNNTVNVSPTALRRYGDTAGAIATQLDSAGTFDLAGNLAAVATAFGLIGQDFLAMFAPAQANHAENYADLATLFSRRARSAAANAAAYEGTDQQHADALRAVAAGIDTREPA